MAYRTFCLYNIDKPVGKGCANAPNDVRLIQGLLGLITKDARVVPFLEKLCTEKKLGKLPALPPASGAYNAATEFWILAMQHFMNVRSKVTADGVVHPLPSGNNSFAPVFQSGGGTQYTLAHLNKLAILYSSRGFVELGDQQKLCHTVHLDGSTIIVG